MTRTERVADDVPQVGRAPRARIPRVAYLVGVLGVLWFLFGAVGGSYQGKLASVQKNDNAAYLPNSAESTKVDHEAQNFRTVQSVPGFVVYQRSGGLTAADRAKISADVGAFRATPGVAKDEVRFRSFPPTPRLPMSRYR